MTYKDYMNEQQVSGELHQRLLDLNGSKKRRNHWRQWLALAACCALVLGLGVWSLGGETMPPDLSRSSEIQWDTSGFLVQGGTDAEKVMLPSVPWIAYPDRTNEADMQLRIALPEGSFSRELTKEDIQLIFWGPEGKPEDLHFKVDGGDLPWMLFWGGYTLNGYVYYDGGGQMFWLNLFGSHPDGNAFHLQLAPGQLPPTCKVEPDIGSTDVMGVPVTGWSRSYDRDGDGADEYICVSEFMAGDVGVRFENAGAYSDGGSGGANFFNALLVRQALSADGGLHLGHLLRMEDVPAWREAEFETLAKAREEGAFAPYLPEQELSDYGEFYGRLTYQEGNEHVLWVRWSRGYDDVEVQVQLPEGTVTRRTVDASVPESYDTRLYSIPWADSVPEEYWDSFYSPDFRAEDMSLAIVQARGTEKDTGGTAYRFGVLHANGVLVKYSCNGLTAQQVWELVEPTLKNND